MDVDYWDSRIHSDKHLCAFSAPHFSSGDSDANEDAKTYFTCPFCYFDIDLSGLGVHLQEEHCFDVKNALTYGGVAESWCIAFLHISLQHLSSWGLIGHNLPIFQDRGMVCPLCALNLGKDIVGHFRVHHANSLKSKRKPKKSTFWSHNAREMSSVHGHSRVGGNMVDASPDPLLAPFLSSYTKPKTDTLQDGFTSDISTNLDTNSSKASPSGGKDYTKKLQRAEFTRELIFSLIS